MDYNLQRCGRVCAATQRELQPGETIFSALRRDGSELVRADYAAEAWTQELASGAIGWWKSQIPTGENKKPVPQWAPNDVMLDFFEQLADQPEKEEMRYILALLLVRRRVLQLEDDTTDPLGREAQLFYSAKREAEYIVTVALPNATQAKAIDDELQTLLQIDAPETTKTVKAVFKKAA